MPAACSHYCINILLRPITLMEKMLREVPPSIKSTLHIRYIRHFRFIHATTTKTIISTIIVERYFISEQPKFRKSSSSMEQMLVIRKMITIFSLYVLISRKLRHFVHKRQLLDSVLSACNLNHHAGLFKIHFRFSLQSTPLIANLFLHC